MTSSGRQGDTEVISYVPVRHREAHGVPDKNDCNDRIGAELLVTIDAVCDGKLTPSGHTSAQGPHCKHQAEPVHLVGRTNSPQKQGAGDNYHQCAEEPEAELRLHDTLVMSGFPKNERIAKITGIQRSAIRVSCSVCEPEVTSSDVPNCNSY